MDGAQVTVETPRRLPPHRIAELAEAHFGEPVEAITAPGGRRRDSVRLHFLDRTVIASHRRSEARRLREEHLLETLSAHGAPVPEYLGSHEGLIFQSDAGRDRLTAALTESPADTAFAAIRALEALRGAAERAGLNETLAPAGLEPSWLRRFAKSPLRLSERLGIESPDYRPGVVIRALTTKERRFFKWDARPGNGALSERGVIWFDWEQSGLREGIEDIAILAADEFWPLSPDTTLEIAREAGVTVTPMLTRYATFQAASRLALIFSQKEEAGWVELDASIHYDYIGAHPDLVTRLAEHGANWAAKDDATAPIAPWFENAARAILG